MIRTRIISCLVISGQLYNQDTKYQLFIVISGQYQLFIVISGQLYNQDTKYQLFIVISGLSVPFLVGDENHVRCVRLGGYQTSSFLGG